MVARELAKEANYIMFYFYFKYGGLLKNAL